MQVKANLELTETRQVCFLLFQLFTSKFLLCAPKVFISHLQDCLGFWNRCLIITGHLILIIRRLGMIIFLPNCYRKSLITHALCWLLDQFAFQEVFKLHILIAFEKWSILSFSFQSAATPACLIISIFTWSNNCLVIVVVRTRENTNRENTCRVNSFVSLNMGCMATISKLDVDLSVDYVFNLC